MGLDLILKDIENNPWIRENFFRIQKFMNSVVFSDQTFKVFNVDIKAADTSFKIPHGLAFIPEDIIVTHVEGDFNFYFRYQEFDRDNLYVTAAGPVKLKFLAGSFKSQIKNEGQGLTYPLVPPP